MLGYSKLISCFWTVCRSIFELPHIIRCNQTGSLITTINLIQTNALHDHISEKDKESPPLKFSYLNGILLLGNWLECFMDCFIKIQTAPSYYSSMSPTSDLTSNMHVRPGILIDMLESV